MNEIQQWKCHGCTFQVINKCGERREITFTILFTLMILGIKGQKSDNNPSCVCCSWSYLGSNLVATLAGLKVDNLSHFRLKCDSW